MHEWISPPSYSIVLFLWSGNVTHTHHWLTSRCEHCHLPKKDWTHCPNALQQVSIVFNFYKFISKYFWRNIHETYGCRVWFFQAINSNDVVKMPWSHEMKATSGMSSCIEIVFWTSNDLQIQWLCKWFWLIIPERCAMGCPQRLWGVNRYSFFQKQPKPKTFDRI